MPDIDGKLNLTTHVQNFGTVNYIVFSLMLLSCALIGVYFGFIEKKCKKKKAMESHESEVAQEYLMGRRQMSVIPVSLSLVSSWISGISLLGTTTDIYYYGTSYFFVIIALGISSTLIGLVYLPVFYNLRLTSLNEYLEMRFDKRTRLLTSVLYTIGTIAYLPVVIYVPTLAFKQVSGSEDSIFYVPLVACVICIFYTLVGGIKAVIWTDCIQTLVMVGSMIVIIVKGTNDLGGFEAVWNQNRAGDRLDYPELTLDITVRHSVISLLFGGTTFYIATCIMGQSMTQRYLSLPTLKKANYALVIFTILLSALIGICCYSGMLAYATYHDCDPFTKKLIKNKDQLLPFLAIGILDKLPGLSGLFVAGIFSASLSSLSTSFNSMAAIVLEDYYKPFANQPLSEKQTSYLMRSTVFGVGIISLALVFVVAKLDATVLELSMKLGGVTLGATFGIFTMGLMCPWVNKRGAFTGGIVGLLVMVLIFVFAQYDIQHNELTFPQKSLSINNCENKLLSDMPPTNSTIPSNNTGSWPPLHHMSYLLYTIVGGLVAIIVGSLTSLLCEEKIECDMDPLLFSPFVRKFINSRKLLSIRPDVREKSCVIHAFETNDTQL